MKQIINLIKNFINKKEPKKILGRWELDKCNNKVNRKIDYSNEDHCGPCGQYKIEPIGQSKIENHLELPEQYKIENYLQSYDKN